MNDSKLTLSPKILGFWTRCIRVASKMSQEALAESSNLNIRTIQRIESGEPVNITTRRCLAKGLGYDDQNVFDDPKFIANIFDILNSVQKHNEEEQKKQHPEHMSVKAAQIETGDALLALTQGSSAYVFHADETISDDAQRAAASIFDYLQDLDGILDDVPFSQQLNCAKELREMLGELKNHGAILYTATRQTKIVGENWMDKTPMSWTIRYLTAVPADKKIDELMVPKRIS